MLQLRQGSDFENGKAATSRALSPFLELCWFVWRREAICRSVGLVRLATCKLRGVECPCLSNSQFWRHDNHCRAPIGVPIYPIWGSHVKNETRDGLCQCAPSLQLPFFHLKTFSSRLI